MNWVFRNARDRLVLRRRRWTFSHRLPYGQSEFETTRCKGGEDMRMICLSRLWVFATLLLAGFVSAEERPNILVIWGDDVRQGNISAYSQGMPGYRTPNIDRLASEGLLFTDYYGGSSSTAGRASYLTGQSVCRTGLSANTMPRAAAGLHADDPTIALLLREYGYTSGLFGKYHVGDRDRHLPTNHGFDEFFGSLYDYAGEDIPNARGVIRSYVNGRIVDTGPLTDKRMATLDGETIAAAIDFIEHAHEENQPFYVWWNGTGTQFAADAMSEHDGHVGELLAKLDELGMIENTIVHYSSDGGLDAGETRSAAISPFSIAAGAAADGNFRVPSIVRWPGKIAAASVSNEIMTHLDWLPTLLAIAGAENLEERLSKDGVRAEGKHYQVQLDGYNFEPHLLGSQSAGPRREVFYFDRTGALVALRYAEWKGTFPASDQDEALSSVVQVTNLRSNSYENFPPMADDALTNSADAALLLAPAEAYVGQLLATFAEFPPRDPESAASVEAVMPLLSQPSP